MNRVLSLYDQALTSVPANITDEKAVGQTIASPAVNAISSINKNKAMVYKHQIEHFQEVYFTDDNEKWYDEQIKKLSFLLEMFCKCVNEALYHNKGQSTAWLCKMMELGAYVAENKLVKHILRQEENDPRTQ